MEGKLKMFEDEVYDIISDLERRGVGEKVFSDVVDDEGNQYVDLVQEGGGVLGVALLGYTYVLEKMGLRFYSLAGTSAGAINAMAIGGAGDFKEEKSGKILEFMANKSFSDFIDGSSDANDLINYYIDNKPLDTWEKTRTVIKAAQVLDDLSDFRGLCRGEDFYEWMKKFLDDNGIKNTADLNRRFGITPSYVKIRGGIDRVDPPEMKIIVADVTTETKAVFPEMADIYWNNYQDISPAFFVRASMSIPAFFFPYETWSPSKDREKWAKRVKYYGDIPERITFVDGGMMSNFPIDELHKDGIVPKKPTFGIKLGKDRNKPQDTESFFSLISATFNSARHIMDYTYYLKNNDYKKIVKEIPMDEFDWLNFNIKEDEMLRMFRRGAEAAREFLIEFDWEGYKKIRRDML